MPGSVWGCRLRLRWVTRHSPGRAKVLVEVVHSRGGAKVCSRSLAYEAPCGLTGLKIILMNCCRGHLGAPQGGGCLRGGVVWGAGTGTGDHGGPFLELVWLVVSCGVVRGGQLS